MSEKKTVEFVNWFGPILDALRELGGSGKPTEVCEWISNKMKLPDSFLEERISNGQSKFQNQVAWARQYLVWEGFLDSSVRGTWTLTPSGYLTKLNDEQARQIFLKQAAIYRAAHKKKTSEQEILKEQEEVTPDNFETSNSPSLLDLLQKLTPSGFEKICGMLLRESGFENVTITGRSHDGGIDGFGTLEMNPFVSFKVLFQCKRYSGTVARAQVGDFRNAMLGRAEKGIIMTTGNFSQDAIKEAHREGAPKVELVDGEKLVEMFKKVELGVKPKTIYEVDLKFFEPFIEIK
jgi:restriction system protein